MAGAGSHFEYPNHARLVQARIAGEVISGLEPGPHVSGGHSEFRPEQVANTDDAG